MEIGQKVRVKFVNQVRRGILHGEIIDVTPYEFKLMQFTDDRLVITIKRKQIIEIIEL